MIPTTYKVVAVEIREFNNVDNIPIWHGRCYGCGFHVKDQQLSVVIRASRKHINNCCVNTLYYPPKGEYYPPKGEAAETWLLGFL